MFPVCSKNECKAVICVGYEKRMRTRPQRSWVEAAGIFQHSSYFGSSALLRFCLPLPAYLNAKVACMPRAGTSILLSTNNFSTKHGAQVELLHHK